MSNTAVQMNVSNINTDTSSESKKAPKRQVTRAKKQTSNITVQEKAEAAQTFIAPTPEPVPVAESTIEPENITISHSIRIIKDPATNTYSYSYIGPNGDEELGNSSNNNGHNSDSNSDNSSSVNSDDSDSDSDNESEKNKYLLSSAKEIAEKLSTQTIDMEGCEPLYTQREITHDILLPFILINMHASSRSNILALLHTTLVSCIEGRCISEGFIKPNSVRIIDFKCGKIVGKNVQFNLVIECLICNPVEQTVICCFAKNITQAGIRALSADEHLPVVVYIARDYNVNNPNIYYNSVKEGDAIKVRVIGKRFEINDKNIQIIGDLVVPKKERSAPISTSSQKTKQPLIINSGPATTTTVSTSTAPSTVASKSPKKPKEPKAPKEPKTPKALKSTKEPVVPKAPRKLKKNQVVNESSENVENASVSNSD